MMSILRKSKRTHYHNMYSVALCGCAMNIDNIITHSDNDTNMEMEGVQIRSMIIAHHQSVTNLGYVDGDTTLLAEYNQV